MRRAAVGVAVMAMRTVMTVLTGLTVVLCESGRRHEGDDRREENERSMHCRHLQGRGTDTLARAGRRDP
jgi:hypothetical protein